MPQQQTKQQSQSTTGKFPHVFLFPKARIFDPGSNVLMVANLFDFKINDDQTRPDHDLFLGTIVAPLIIANPLSGARLVGLASRSGSAQHNLDLSKRRAKNAEMSLLLFLFASSLSAGAGSRTSIGGQGEQFAANLNVPDGTEDSRFRSVLVTVLRDRNKNSPVRLLPP
jgi:outer membrane protein OmpA-like peptidoglycan-associated protein